MEETEERTRGTKRKALIQLNKDDQPSGPEQRVRGTKRKPFQQLRRAENQRRRVEAKIVAEVSNLKTQPSVAMLWGGLNKRSVSERIVKKASRPSNRNRKAHKQIDARPTSIADMWATVGGENQHLQELQEPENLQKNLQHTVRAIDGGELENNFLQSMFRKWRETSAITNQEGDQELRTNHPKYDSLTIEQPLPPTKQTIRVACHDPDRIQTKRATLYTTNINNKVKMEFITKSRHTRKDGVCIVNVQNTNSNTNEYIQQTDRQISRARRQLEGTNRREVLGAAVEQIEAAAVQKTFDDHFSSKIHLTSPKILSPESIENIYMRRQSCNLMKSSYQLTNNVTCGIVENDDLTKEQQTWRKWRGPGE